MAFRCRPDADWLFDRPNDARAEIDPGGEGPPVTPSARLLAIVAGEPTEGLVPGEVGGGRGGRTGPMSPEAKARAIDAFRRTRERWGQRGGRRAHRGRS